MKMQPRKLRIKGLNSFIEEQTIDFIKLAERGLFGIFGPTGSGKSTILDAIILALYGEIPRNTKEFVNSEVDLLTIEYEFSIRNGGETTIYVVNRTFKKGEDGIRKSKDARLYMKTGESNINIIEEGITNVTNEIQRILGLNVDDFTRSVVLPQGKFNEFLKLTGTDRRNMLERIFGLEKYGRELTEKIKMAKNKKSKEIENIESQLMVYENLTKEQYEEQQKLYELLIKEEQELREELEIICREYEKYQIIWELQQELQLYKNKQEILGEQEKDYLKQKEAFQRAQKADIIKPVIGEMDQIQKDKTENMHKLEELRGKLKSIAEILEKLEKDYSDALQRKNAEHPILVQKETNLNQAVEMLEQKKNMEKERDQLRVLFSKNKENINKNIKKEEEIKYQLLAFEKDLKEIEDKKQKIFVDPAYREEIQRAYEIEKEYNRLIQKEKELQEKLYQFQSHIEKTERIFEEIKSKKQEKNVLFTEAQKALENLKENAPGNRDLLFEQHKCIEELKHKYVYYQDKLHQKKLREESLKNLLAKIQPKEEEKKKILDEKESIKHALELKKKEIEKLQRQNMAAILAQDLKEGESCPVCGSTHHIHIAFEFDQKLYQDVLNDENQLSRQLQELEDKYYAISLECSGMNKEIEQIQQEIDRILSDIENEDIKNIDIRLSQEEEKFKNLQIQIDTWEKDVLKADQYVAELKDVINLLERDEIRIQEGLIKDKNQHKEISEQYHEIKTNLEDIVQQYFHVKEKYKLGAIEDKMKEIREWDKLKVDLEKKEKILRESLKLKEQEKEQISDIIRQCEQENAKIKQSGIEKSRMIEQWSEQIKRLSEDKDPYIYREEVRNQIRILLESEEKLKRAFEKAKNEKSNLEQEEIRLNTYNLTLLNHYEEIRKKLDALLKEHDFLTPEDVIAAWMPKEKREILENAIKAFEEEVKEVQNNLHRIQSKLKEERISSEEWEVLKQKKQTKTEELEMKAKYLAVMQEKLKIMEKNLNTVLELNKQKTKLEYTFSLLDDLYKLVQGNKFVEFVAASRLKYIAKEASKTLKNITRGRYAIELDGSGNFIVRDDFNGGIRRSPSTLSGGETFLTSLSLALALSSQIQLNNSSPLEFFFLDEGFGTLDSNLLDTVMTALEKLHSQQLCVGIISHVEELKNRIPVKLIVEPARQGLNGSKVRIEYS
ncbi:AAA family ATPase [Defluviitalea raffinosedens]|uniref:Nuclease SbcCD subunit C n=2 Tax=Defluviitalea raffinosedens TaxID=1450156 RepID=A0A7C8LD54_9FIRM|nr:AAA family ATPase [Defluviitalea raffinosedens]